MKIDRRRDDYLHVSAANAARYRVNGNGPPGVRQKVQEINPPKPCLDSRVFQFWLCVPNSELKAPDFQIKNPASSAGFFNSGFTFRTPNSKLLTS